MSKLKERDLIEALQRKGIEAKYERLCGSGHHKLRVAKDGKEAFIIVSATPRTPRVFHHIVLDARRRLREAE